MNRSWPIWRCWLLLALITGCSQHWQYSRVLPYPYEQVWQSCRHSVGLAGYSIAASRQQEGRLRSEWLSTLYPLRGNGYRTQVLLQIVPSSGHLVTTNAQSKWGSYFFPASIVPGVYRVRVRVVRQRNYAHHDLMNPGNALWLADGYALKMENFLIKAIESRLTLTDR